MGERTGVLPARSENDQRGGRKDGVERVASSITELLRTVRRSKARVLAAAGDDVESSTQLLLRTVAGEGPVRASALAASVGSDLSTVSRQVAALVGRGLLERRADQLDGRASLLVVTRAGRAVIAQHEQGRSQFFEDVLAGWSEEELARFAGLLAEFTAAYERTHVAWMRDQGRGTEGVGRDMSLGNAVERGAAE